MEIFLSDIVPFFYRRRVSYVDIGAHTGTTYAAIKNSDLFLREAHLVEPNPENFAKLRNTVEESGKVTTTVLYNKAIGSESGTVRMQSADTMSRVTDKDAEANTSALPEGQFEIPLATLDQLATEFTRQHISILKIDVEGFEQEVLKGADRLLREQAIDVIYIEAGMSSENKQQCYYRTIEDHLQKYGYRIFRIYEQKHEWMDDNPILRRVNIAFMSQKFADENPYNITNELFKLKKDYSELKYERDELTRKLNSTEQKLKERARVFEENLKERTKKFEEKLNSIEEHHQSIKSQHQANLRAVVNERDALVEHLQALETRYRKMRSSFSWKATSPIRYVVRRTTALIGRAAGGQAVPTPAPQSSTAQIAKSGSKAKDPARSGRPTIALKLEAQLWGGFSQAAFRDLSALKLGGAEITHEKSHACLALARWHAVEGDISRSVKEMEERRAIDPSCAGTVQQDLLEAFFLSRMGRTNEARALLTAHSDPSREFFASTLLLLANTWNPATQGDAESSEEATLQHINAMYRHYGLSEIEKSDPGKPLSMDNLRGRNVAERRGEDVRVSVIVPVYNAEDTVLTSLRSLSAQSWKNIEVIVVDDCSTDGTADVVEAFCKGDGRFRLIRRTVNAGSYTCRNRALQDVSGQYVTIHDSDDWAHPDRIYAHVRDALDRGVTHNLSRWVRTLPNLHFVGVWRPHHDLINLNMGSFFVSKTLFDKLGPWDEVRISGDSEFITRVEKFSGDSNRKMVRDGCPLLFGRMTSTSLTQTKATSLATVHHGVRREYLEASNYVHALFDRNSDRTLDIGSLKALTTPDMMKAKRAISNVDVLMIFDWNGDDERLREVRDFVAASRKGGLTVGVFHHPTYNLNATKPLSAETRDFFVETGVKVVPAGAPVKARTVVIPDVLLLKDRLDRFPEVDREHVVVIIDERTARLIGRQENADDFDEVKNNLSAHFGELGRWAPVSEQVREAMMKDSRYPDPQGETSYPVFDADEWRVGVQETA